MIPIGIKSARQLFEAEARNVAKAYTKYLLTVPSQRKAPFTLAWAYKLHGEMFDEVWDWAGKRRITAKNLGSPAAQIDPELKDLLDDLAAWQKFGSYPLIEQATRLNHRAVRIHPFNNGNGRWARLLANIWLKRHGAPPATWPDQTIANEGTIRSAYLAAIKAADSGDYAALLSLH